jgi:hypothetical protein
MVYYNYNFSNALAKKNEGVTRSFFFLFKNYIRSIRNLNIDAYSSKLIH